MSYFVLILIIRFGNFALNLLNGSMLKLNVFILFFKKFKTFIFLKRPFEYLILVSIFLNCVALAVYTPYPNKDNNKINSLLVNIKINIYIEINICNKI